MDRKHEERPGAEPEEEQDPCEDAAACWRLDQEIARIRRDKSEGRF